MKTLRSATLIVLAASCNHPCLKADNIFTAMRKHFQEMEDLFEQQMEAVQTRSGADLDVAMQEQDGAGVVVTIKNLETKEIDSALNGTHSRLTITTDSATIQLARQGNVVSARVKQTTKTTSKDKDGKEVVVGSSSSSSSWSQFYKSAVNLANAKADYDSSTKTLVISLPFEQEEKIQVTIK